MAKSIRRISPVIFALALYPCGKAPAAVSLVLSDKDATPNTTTVVAGTTFPVSVLLTSSSNAAADQVTAVDYTLHGSANGLFTLISRNTQTSGSSFTDPFATDGTVANTTIGTSNTNDLGASEANTNNPVSNGTFEVADYVIKVAAGTLPGLYTLTTASNPPGIGYEQAGPSFTDTPFSAQGSFSVTVAVPEPAMLGLAGTSILGLCVRRRPKSAGAN